MSRVSTCRGLATVALFAVSRGGGESGAKAATSTLLARTAKVRSAANAISGLSAGPSGWVSLSLARSMTSSLVGLIDTYHPRTKNSRATLSNMRFNRSSLGMTRRKGRSLSVGSGNGQTGTQKLNRYVLEDFSPRKSEEAVGDSGSRGASDAAVQDDLRGSRSRAGGAATCGSRGDPRAGSGGKAITRRHLQAYPRFPRDLRFGHSHDLFRRHREHD